MGESLPLFFSLLALDRRRDFEELPDFAALRALRCSLRADSSRRSSLIAAVSRTCLAATFGEAISDGSFKNSSSSSGKRSSSERYEEAVVKAYGEAVVVQLLSDGRDGQDG